MYISLMAASVAMVEKTTGVQQVIDRLNHMMLYGVNLASI